MENLEFLKLTKITIDNFLKKNKIDGIETKVTEIADDNYELNISNENFLISYQPDIHSVSIYNKLFEDLYFRNYKLEIKKGVRVTEQLINYLKNELNQK